jgi:NitT/TauT family transport system substrate-binding protein
LVSTWSSGRGSETSTISTTDVGEDVRDHDAVAQVDRLVDVVGDEVIEVPFPDQLAALQSKRVDAIAPVEPFVSQARAAGDRDLFSYFAGFQPKLTVGTYFAMKPYIAGNSNVIDRFVRAMNRSLTYAQAHPQEARQVVLSYTKIPPKVAAKMKLSYWSSDLNVPSIERTAQAAKQFGFVKTAPSVNDLIWHQPGS